MCKVMEEMQKETLLEVAKKMMFDGMLSIEKIAEFVGLSIDEVKRLQVEQGV